MFDSDEGAVSDCEGPLGARLGEVVEVSTTEFVAESYYLHEGPDFGSLVRATEGETTIYAITSGAKTTSIDPGRRAIARGRDEADQDDIFDHNPELSALLRTEFTAALVGFRYHGELHQYLPPRPPRIHGFVHQCSSEEVREFTSRFDFLATLLVGSGRGPTDELVAAVVRQARFAHEGDRAYLVSAGKELARLLGSEPTRLNNVLRRIRP